MMNAKMRNWWRRNVRKTTAVWVVVLACFTSLPPSAVAQEEITDAVMVAELQAPFVPFSSNRRWLNSQIQRLSDGRLMTLTDNGLVFSSDEMVTWSPKQQILDSALRAEHRGSVPDGGGVVFATSKGNWVVVWRDERKPAKLEDYWDQTKGEPVEGATADVWATVSHDQGLTWAKPSKVFVGPGGYPPKQIIETKNGVLVVPIQYHDRAPGRNVIAVARSTDQGESWTVDPSRIDLGGHGHHDGAFEPSLVELKDGRMWMLLRTNKGTLWQTYSRDDGATWSLPTATSIAASSSPPYIGRLSNGKLLLLWNRLDPTDGTAFARRGGDKYFSEEPASWYRQDLLLATSEDEGATWSEPRVVAKHPKKSGRVAYPYFFESTSGNVLVFANQGKVEASIPLKSLP